MRMRLFWQTRLRLLADWWWTIDRPLFLSIVALAGLGYVMTFAASPLMAAKIGLPLYHFAARQIVFLTMALATCLAVSLLTPRQVAQLALGVFVLSLLGLMLVLLVGHDVRGARRWLSLFGFSVQPSEFLKPGFMILTALLFARLAARRMSSLVPFVLLVFCALLLVAQPDIGQTVLLTLGWLMLLFLSGGSLWKLALPGAGLAGFLVFAWRTMPHVAARIDGFLNPALGESYQTEQALSAIANGGVFGTGPGDGYYKAFLPDAHTDYVFAVLAEEGGLLIGGAVMALFALIVLRALARASEARAHWVQLSVAGLVGLFGLQAAINLAVNLNLVPPKGMSLPFLSYGGSSLLATALSLGMVLALTRREIPKLPRPPAVVPQREVMA